MFSVLQSLDFSFRIRTFGQMISFLVVSLISAHNHPKLNSQFRFFNIIIASYAKVENEETNLDIRFLDWCFGQYTWFGKLPKFKLNGQNSTEKLKANFGSWIIMNLWSMGYLSEISEGVLKDSPHLHRYRFGSTKLYRLIIMIQCVTDCSHSLSRLIQEFLFFGFGSYVWLD